MEYLPGYDSRKLRLPDDPETVDCVKCGEEVCKRDALYTVKGWMCEDCLDLEEEEACMDISAKNAVRI